MMAVETFSLAELVAALDEPSAASAALFSRLDAVLRDPGAFYLRDLPVSDELLKSMYATTNSFFEETIEEKTRYRYVDDQYVGWCGAQFLSEYGTTDHKEMFHIGPRVASTLAAHDALGGVPAIGAEIVARALESCALWPDVPASFIVTWRRYYEAMQQAAVSLGLVMSRLLGVAPEEWLGVMHSNRADLAANYYPPVGGTDTGQVPVYNAAHRDLTIFTILHQSESRSGRL